MSGFGHLERFAPVTQEYPVRLIGDQQVDVLGGQPDSITDGERHLGDLPIAAGEHFGDLGFGEPDAALTGAGLPPLARRVDGERHVAGVLAVGAALDVEDR